MMDVSTGELYLEQALASLAAQTFTDFEIVLCAHGANPATAAIVAKWEGIEPRLRVIRCPRLPLAKAHIMVASESRGALLARLDADDVARPERLQQQVRTFIEQPGLGFIGSAVSIINGSGEYLSIVRNPLDHAAIADATRNSCPIVHSSLMVRAELFHQAGGYRDGLNISEDYDLYCRMIEHGRGANSDAVLVDYRIHSNSLTSRQTLRMAIANEAIRVAGLARRNGTAEPFVDGTPSLRRTGALLGLSRKAIRRNVLATAAQSKTSRRLLTGRLSHRVNGWLRNLALQLGLRPVYSALFKVRVWLIERFGR